MKTDKELLELAAKAAGIAGEWVDDYEPSDYYASQFYAGPSFGILTKEGHSGLVWNPLTDNSDALRLAVELRLVVTVGSKNVEVRRFTGADDEPIGLFCRIESQVDDPLSATRRAIVRAAAAIGESK